MRNALTIFLGALLGVAILWACLAVAGVAGQRQLFYGEGREELFDYWMPRMCLEQGYRTAKCADWGLDDKAAWQMGYAPDREGEISLSGWYQTPAGQRVFITGNRDKVYPAFALLPLKFFPTTRAGAYSWSIFAGLVFLASLVLCAQREKADGRASYWPLVLGLSMPFLFNLERGNPIWLSAAAVGVFLAWWDADSPIRRGVAAICLGVAAVLKIAPAVLGVLYLARLIHATRAQRRDILVAIVLSAGTALILFGGSWFFVPEKFGAIPLMMENAVHHADTVRRQADFGLIAVWRALRILLHQDVQSFWPGLKLVAFVSQGLGVLALLYGAIKRNYILVIGGLLLAAGNMYYYAALYLLPVFVLQCPRLRLEWPLWFLIVCPFQLIVFGHPSNAILCNLSLFALMLLQLYPEQTQTLEPPPTQTLEHFLAGFYLCHFLCYNNSLNFSQGQKK